MLLSNQVIELTQSGMGGVKNGWGSGFLGVTFNKFHSPDGTVIALCSCSGAQKLHILCSNVPTVMKGIF